MERATIVSILEKGKLKRLLLRKGFIVSNYKPDFIVCYGGDGTALFAEREYPGIQKLLVKSGKPFRKYDYTYDQLEKIFDKIKKDEFKIVEEMKISAKFGNKEMVALNEVQVHTASPIRAVRFSAYAGSKRFKNLIGDGVIVSTPFGSTGYYHSAGGKPFKHGIGVAFNNLCQRIKPLVLPDSKKVKIKIEREDALLLYDNYEKSTELKPGDSVEIKRAKQLAKFIAIK